jgi:hypothetical protein
MLGLDWSARQADAEMARQVVALGYTTVFRYLPLPRSTRADLTRDELEVLLDAGLEVVPIYEWSTGRALGGFEQGLRDGATSFEAARNLGFPQGTTVVAAIDFGPTPDQLHSVGEYLRGFDAGLGDYRICPYGSYSVIAYALDHLIALKTWQTVAWSGGRRHPHATAFQRAEQRDICGEGCDVNDIYGDLGGWRRTPLPAPTAPQEDLLMSAALNDHDARWALVLTWFVDYLGRVPTTPEEHDAHVAVFEQAGAGACLSGIVNSPEGKAHRERTKV